MHEILITWVWDCWELVDDDSKYCCSLYYISTHSYFFSFVFDSFFFSNYSDAFKYSRIKQKHSASNFFFLFLETTKDFSTLNFFSTWNSFISKFAFRLKKKNCFYTRVYICFTSLLIVASSREIIFAFLFLSISLREWTRWISRAVYFRHKKCTWIELR